MKPFCRPRRFGIALAALFVAASLFRGPIAQALVVRGDDYLYRNRAADALERYRRALAIAPDLQSAADRIVFVSMEQHSPRATASGIATATRFLRYHPHDPVLLNDRALCYLIERRFKAARHDFEEAAAIAKSSQFYVFAGWAAYHAAQPRAARELWRDALAIDRKNRVAITALAERVK